VLLSCLAVVGAAEPVSFGGIYPHLATFNNEGECGTGAVVPFAERLWVISYGPHLPKGSSDKLYEIDGELRLTVRPESLGGTPANRLIHRESNQLFIGPYAIDAQRKVRAIPYKEMQGRHTACARHLTDPAGKVYFATMEEGFYEVDVKTLAVKTLYPDANGVPGGGGLLPGVHGKGCYSGQGVLVYANNGTNKGPYLTRPETPAGCLAEWDGRDWRVVRENQFCEVTGPGGIFGNERPATDPLWATGWDHRSLLLMVRDGGRWTGFRLPKPTHTYDGAHGWNTEWPRIREIGERDLLMTMHGGFWRFPATFSAANTAGLRPRSTYLKVIGDFCQWNGRLVFGCDDAAKSEFLNKRKAKGALAGPGQSQSNLWFTEPSRVDQLGPARGVGAVWLRDDLKAGQVSEPFLFAGYERRAVHLMHKGAEPVTFSFEVDRDGRGQWQPLRGVTVPAGGYQWTEFAADERGEWVRVKVDRACVQATVQFTYAQPDPRTSQADPLFDGLASAADREHSGGLLRARGENKRTLAIAGTRLTGTEVADTGYYELDEKAVLQRVDDAKAHEYQQTSAAIPPGVLSVDAASVLYVDDQGKRWRLPKGDPAFDALTGQGLLRMDREVCTERDLFNCHGTFYELPAENAGGFAKIRPVATHNRRIVDYCSYRGLLVLSGVRAGVNNPRLVRSADGQAAVWLGAVDELWRLGKPVGRGGPWHATAVKAGVASDAYLCNGFDRKRLTLRQTGGAPVEVRLELELTGDGLWAPARTLTVPAGGEVTYEFPAALAAYWLRLVPARDAVLTAEAVYS
jgi:hypothetical protein